MTAAGVHPEGPTSSASSAPRLGRGRRYFAVVLALSLVVFVLGGVKALQISGLIAFGKKAQQAGPPPEMVGTYVAAEQTWEQTLQSIGSVAAGRGVAISNDAPGIVWRIDFDSGAVVRAGQVLVELDARVERAQLASARARLDLARTNAGRTNALFATGAVARAQRDTDDSQLAADQADVDALAAQIGRKLVRAPFAGRLGIRLVNVGQYLPSGTPITNLESADATYVDFSIPQQDLSRIGVGMPIRVALGAGDAGASRKEVEGSVFAIEPDVDPATRNAKLRATVPRESDWVRPGMFVDVSVILPAKDTVVAVPATAVVRASYGDSVFVVEDAKDPQGRPQVRPDGQASRIARQQFVRLGPMRGDFVAIAEGVKPGEEVVVAGAFKLRNRGRVIVDNQVSLHPELEPHPANR
ncbi:MAG TPA: efflux RND transporter periplasmic adaptor subunit [Polyangiaceae bacterium]|nr:efflux RND transporter periplasmic adaptor subunit [Polyangiaceae bacterium]